MFASVFIAVDKVGLRAYLLYSVQELAVKKRGGENEEQEQLAGAVKKNVPLLPVAAPVRLSARLGRSFPLDLSVLNR